MRAELLAHLVQLQSATFRMRFMRGIDGARGALAQRVPDQHCCRDLILEKNFAVLRQSPQGSLNLSRAEMRSLEHTGRLDYLPGRNLRPNRQSNIVGRDCARSEEFSFLGRSGMLLCVEIENNSARNRMLLRGIPNYQKIANEREKRNFQSHLCGRAFSGTNRPNFGKNDLRQAARCPVMNIGGGARLNWRRALQTRRSRQDDVQSGSWFETCRSNDIAALNLIQAKLGQID